MSRRHTLSFTSYVLPIPFSFQTPLLMKYYTEPLMASEDRNHTPAIGNAITRVSLMFVAISCLPPLKVSKMRENYMN